jgi:MFS transporter, YQGE family, putative transporter
VDFLFNYVYQFLKRYLGVHRHLSDNAKTLIAMVGIYDFTFALSSVFINIFLFKNRSDLTIPAYYNLASYGTIMLAFWIGGHLSQRWSHLLSYQLGLFFNASVFLMILLLREDTLDHPALLGLLSGLGIGFYYLGQHSLTLDMTETKDRDYLLSVSMFLSSILRILAPALAGWTIASFRSQMVGVKDSSLGYYLVFTLALMMYLGLIFKSLQLKVNPRKERFEFFKVLTFKNNQGWNRQMWIQFVLGLRNGVFWFLISLLVFRVSHNEAVVGDYAMISNFLAVLTAYGLSRWATGKNRNGGMWVSSLLIFAACATLSWKVNYLSLLVYAVLNMVGVTWFQVVFGALGFEVVERAREYRKRKLEYLAVRELPLAVGRILGLFLFMFSQSRFGEDGLRWAMLVLGVIQLTVFLFLPKNKFSESLTSAIEKA